MIVGLTGGIGSGKSMVARVFQILGCAVFNSDKEAASLYYDDVIKEKVIALLGPESYTENCALNKKHVSQRIFESETLRLALNAIIHPAVGKRFTDFVNLNRNRIIIKETALLFEAGLEKEVEQVIVVAAPEELRIERVMARDMLSREEVLRKMKSQLPEIKKTELADFIIYNDEKQFLITQVIDVFNKLKNV